jgi:hypothetical protein
MVQRCRRHLAQENLHICLHALLHACVCVCERGGGGEAGGGWVGAAGPTQPPLAPPTARCSASIHCCPGAERACRSARDACAAWGRPGQRCHMHMCRCRPPPLPEPTHGLCRGWRRRPRQGNHSKNTCACRRASGCRPLRAAAGAPLPCCRPRPPPPPPRRALRAARGCRWRLLPRQGRAAAAAAAAAAAGSQAPAAAQLLSRPRAAARRGRLCCRGPVGARAAWRCCMWLLASLVAARSCLPQRPMHVCPRRPPRLRDSSSGAAGAWARAAASMRTGRLLC